MESTTNDAPLIAIVGETASGKTALALRIAEQFDGEIICADSRTVYKGMDIGTAKPTVAEQARVRHHLLDIVAPDEPFTAFAFKQLAQAAISDITSRGKMPLLVGGSGLYVDAVLYDFEFRAPADPRERQRLQALTIDELQTALADAGIPLPQNARNPRHLVRALEAGGYGTAHKTLRPNTLVIGLQIDRELLKANITKRVDAMLAAGFIDEVKRLVQQYGADVPAMQAPGYKAFAAYLEGAMTLDEAKQSSTQATLQLAKRQRTWFKRNKSIHWVSKQDDAVELITTFLNK